LRLDVFDVEYLVRAGRTSRGQQPSVYFHPNTASWVKQRRGVVVVLIAFGRTCRLSMVPQLQQAGFNTRQGPLLHQQVQVAHRPEVGLRIVLPADGDALQQGYRGCHGLTGLENFIHGIRLLAGDHLSRQAGASQFGAEWHPRRITIILDGLVQKRAKACGDGPADDRGIHRRQPDAVATAGGCSQE
jgi:hypothetical protein